MDVHEITSIARTTIERVENGSTAPRDKTMLLLLNTYTSRGIEFAPDGWVRLKPGDAPAP